MEKYSSESVQRALQNLAKCLRNQISLLLNTILPLESLAELSGGEALSLLNTRPGFMTGPHITSRAIKNP